MAAAKKRFKKSDELLGVNQDKEKKLESDPLVQKALEKEIEDINDQPIAEPEKLTFKSYFNTLIEVFTKKAVRDEFFNFLKGKKPEQE